MSIYITGHKIPDTDSICAAISLAYLKNSLGEDCIAARQGELNPESKWVLERYGFKPPLLKTEYTGEALYLVDFSDLAQAPDDIDKATIKGIVDHHKLGDITTSAPLECWIRPVGCSNTIIKEIFDYYNVDIPSNLAAIMLCAILSDTVIFKSPTCTKEDIKAAEDLAIIAKLNNLEQLGMEMFLVKSAIKNASPKELVKRDYKDFIFNSKKVGIGQLEVVDLSVFNDKKEALLEEMRILKDEDDRDTVILLLTDIIDKGSLMLCVSNSPKMIENAFDIKLKDNQIYLPGVLSRKKQIVPFLEKSFKNGGA